MQDVQEYWSAVRERICSRCVDYDRQKHCLLDSPFECTLVTSLPVIVDIVTHAISKKKGYKRELRTIVCGECKYQSINEVCSLSEDMRCSVIKYFSEVIETVKNVYIQHHH